MFMIDSNIWAYYLDADAPEHKSVTPAVKKALREGVLINTVVVMEVAHFLIKNLGPVVGREKLDVFLGFPMQVDDFTLDLARASADELCKYSHLGIGGRDATMLASMGRRHVDKLMTHDEALKRVPDIKVVDPVG
ncbi:MAG: type II toxin-antitoxin system VapC family toxin [Hadesarchaea archaeon]|nr:type II toxin-antitoxin system VapC family toxin [Hadesarchaea archaeon]